MKKLLFLILTICILAIMPLSVVALADEGESTPDEIVTELSDETPETELVSDETESVKGLTDEELKGLVNAYLTEQQKEQAERTANILAEKFGLNGTTAYLVAVAIIVVFIILVWLIGLIVTLKSKNGKADEKIKALQAYVDEKSQDYEKLLNLAESLDGTILTDYFKGATKAAVDGDIEKIAVAIADELHFDKEVVKKAVGDVSTLTAQVKVIIEALQLLAVQGNQTAMANKLTESPTANSYNELVYENAKLKAALGDKAVKAATNEINE